MDDCLEQSSNLDPFQDLNNEDIKMVVEEVKIFEPARVNADRSPSDHQLSEQILELQEAVKEMKGAFTLALHELGSVDKGDSEIKTVLDKYRSESQEQIAEIVKLILSMKAEFSIVKSQVQLVQESQYSLQQQVHGLLYERDVLLEELESNGIISDHSRKRLQHCRFINHPPSGSQSNDSGVAFLLEKAQAAFHQNRSSLTSPHSDQDSNSLPENPANRVSSIVQDYLAGLGRQGQEDTKAQVNTNEYDSDSSLTNAVNKSLTLSTSLGKQCGLEFDHRLKGAVQTEKQISHQTSRDEQITSTPVKSPVKLSRSISRERTAKERSRHKIARDLVDTERVYCKTLWILQDTFADPLKKSGILNNRDVNTLFPEEIQQLYEKHCTLLQKFEDRLASWKWNGVIADILDAFTDSNQSNVLGLYKSYVNDFPEVMKTFHKSCQQSYQFTKFLKKCLDQPSCTNVDLGTLLLTPVQRIPNYIFFLKKMLNWTEGHHPDSGNIHNCIKTLKDFLNRLNDAMEHSFQLIAAQVNNTSAFLCDDKFIDDDYNDNDSVNNAETILMDDCSDADSLIGKLQMLKVEYESSQRKENRFADAETKCDPSKTASVHSKSEFQENHPPIVKNKQVPKKPPRTPRRTSCQNELCSPYQSSQRECIIRDPVNSSPQQMLLSHKNIQQASSPDVRHISQSCQLTDHYWESNKEQITNDICKSCSPYETCHMTPSRSLSHHKPNIHYMYDAGVSYTPASNHNKREMGKSLNCIHEAPVSISNSQSSLTKSQSVNKVSEWKKGNESPVVENQVKRMSKMKSLRTSFKNLFKKRKCSVEIANLKDKFYGDSSELSSSFITLNEDLDKWVSIA